MDKKNVPSIDELITRSVDYPTHDELLDGLKDGWEFCYVSHQYLNGFINYVDIIDSYMIRRYADSDESWAKACAYIDSKDGAHTILPGAIEANEDGIDDILILAKSEKSY